MKIRNMPLWMLIGVSLLALQSIGYADDDAITKKIDLRILYSGHPDSAREKDFVTFLKKHFVEVAAGDFAEFNGIQAKGFDVVILDYDGDGFKAPRPRVPRNYTKPTITVGVVGAFLGGRLGLKTSYL